MPRSIHDDSGGLTNYHPPECEHKVIDAIVERLDLTLASAKQWLGITDDALDDLLNDLIVVAKETADKFCNNPFTTTEDDGTVTENDIPASVKIGVLQVLRYLYEDFLGASGSADIASGPVIKQKEGDVETAYGAGASSAIANTSNAALHIVIPHTAQNLLKQYRLEPGC